MTRRMKAYLPRWILAIVLPMIVILWAFLTYSAFGTASGREELGIVGWVVLTVVFVLVGVMMWLMTSGRLPAYIIEIEDDEGRKP